MSEISDALRIPFATASRNLGILHEAGFVTSTRRNTEVCYAISMTALLGPKAVLLTFVKQAGDEALKDKTYHKRSAYEPWVIEGSKSLVRFIKGIAK